MLECVVVKAEAVRRELQHAATPSLRRRRWIARLAAVALADAAVVALRQMGAIRRLPDFPGRLFDANAVTTSLPAFLFGAPDATIAAVMQAVALVAASAGGTARSGRSRWWSAVLLADVLGGAVGAAAYLGVMIKRERRACAYCLVAIAASFAMVPLAVREAAETFPRR